MMNWSIDDGDDGAHGHDLHESSAAAAAACDMRKVLTTKYVYK